MAYKRKRTSTKSSGTKRRRTVRRSKRYATGSYRRGGDRIATRIVIPATTDGSGNLALAFNANGSIKNNVDVNAAAVMFNGAAVATSSTGVNSLSTIYDTGRYTAVKVRYIPDLVNEVASVAAYKPIYMGYDRDGIDSAIGSLAGSAAYLDLPRVQVKNLYKPFTKYWKFPYYAKTTKIPTTVAGSPTAPTGADMNQNLAGMWHNTDFALYDTSAVRGIHCALGCQGASNSTTYGTFIVTLYCAFKDRNLK